MVEFRKLIAFGKSSYVVSLPKKWIEANKLSKGDSIVITEQNDTLTITAKLKEEEQVKKKIIIDIDNKEIYTINREIIAAYMNNYSTIQIVGKNLKNIAKEVRDVLQSLMALEIIEQTSDKIVVQDFLNMKQISILSVIKKTDIITRSILKDLKLCFTEDISKNIIHRDYDVNKLYFLLFRTIKHAFESAEVRKSLNMTPYELLNHSWINMYCEEIADHTKEISKYLVKLKIDKKVQDVIIGVLDKIYQQYTSTMKAYYEKNKQLILKVASNKYKLLSECDKLSEKHYNKKYMPNTCEQIKNLVETIHEMGRRIYC